jgi:kumamolisin
MVPAGLAILCKSVQPPMALGAHFEEARRGTRSSFPKVVSLKILATVEIVRVGELDMPTNRVIIRGSSRGSPLHGGHVVGPVPADERFEVTVRVRRRLGTLVVNGFHADQPSGKREYLTREQYTGQCGSDPFDMAKVEAFAKAHDLIVVESSPARHSVFLSGTAANFAEAFDTTIERYEHAGRTYRGRTGSLWIPADLAGIVEGVFGIDNRPVAKPHFQRSKMRSGTGLQNHVTSASSFTLPQVAKLYNFPTGLDGSGQCIGIIALGRGYRTGDIETYFRDLGLPMPHVSTVRVDGGHDQPAHRDSADGEVTLDIEIAAAVAPKAKIAVYFAPNTDKGFLDAITMAIDDTTNKPSVISITCGGPEVNWTLQAMSLYNQAFETAAALGVTVCCSAGNNGSGGGVSDGRAHVDFPASSPFALGCGGTKLTVSGGTISEEVVWNESADSASGGGISDFFALPEYQIAANVPRPARGVPDVAGNADPRSGIQGACGRGGVRDRRDRCGRSIMGWIDRANQPDARSSGRIPEPAALRSSRRWGVPGHHLGHQWRLLGQSRMGCLHRIGVT